MKSVRNGKKTTCDHKRNFEHELVALDLSKLKDPKGRAELVKVLY